MITIYGAIKTLNFYDRLKTEFNFDIKKFALAERKLQMLSQSDFKMRESLLFSPEELNDIFYQF